MITINILRLGSDLGYLFVGILFAKGMYFEMAAALAFTTILSSIDKGVFKEDYNEAEIENNRDRG